MARIRITQRRSLIGRPSDQRDTVRRLGLRRIGHSVLHDDSPAVLGMAFKVRHLVEVTPASEEPAEPAPAAEPAHDSEQEGSES